jgi:hypothetical protein
MHLVVSSKVVVVVVVVVDEEEGERLERSKVAITRIAVQTVYKVL